MRYVTFFLMALAIFTSSSGQRTVLDPWLCSGDSVFYSSDSLKGRYSFHEIEATAFSLLVNGVPVVQYPTDSSAAAVIVIDRLMTLPENSIASIKVDSATEYYKVLQVDSILCERFASFFVPDSYLASIDSLYREVKNQLGIGKSWNELSIHPSDELSAIDRKRRGDTGWLQVSEITTSLQSLLHSNQPGDVFMYKAADSNYAWIIYKTDNARMFAKKRIRLLIKKNEH